MNDGNSGVYVDSVSTVNEYVTRFNCDIAGLVAAYGEERINKAIWYIYSSSSGYIEDAMDESLGQQRIDFVASIRELYTDGFATYCSRYFSHLDRGPEAERPMNSACYMLWDLADIGDSAINGDDLVLEASLDVLRFALTLDNWACNESALHGLGHLAKHVRKTTSPLITAFLCRKGVPPELREYAGEAEKGAVL